MRDSSVWVIDGPTPVDSLPGKMNQDWETSKVRQRQRRDARDADSAQLRELRQETRELRRDNSRRELRQPRPAERRDPPYQRSRVRPRRTGRRQRLVILAGLGIVALALVLGGAPRASHSFRLPSRVALAGMPLGKRIVAIASSQVGYRTDPSHSYCNKFSAYWGAGASGCANGDRAEEWCADFAAWAWQKAGIAVVYGYNPGELNAGAISFYRWGVAHGTWHPAGSGYRAVAGDVAVYGLNLASSYPSAAHVAIVVDDPPGQRGPDVINGDGDRTGFSVVETGSDQFLADAGHHHSALLAGYVSP